MSRRQTYSQMPLPFDLADLRKPVRRALPPGLREFAQADGISDERVRQLAATYPTMRGRKPATASEWRTLHNAVAKFFDEAQK